MVTAARLRTANLMTRKWICPKCREVFCKPEARQPEVLKAFDRHMLENHAEKPAKVLSDKSRVRTTGKRQQIGRAHV